MKWAIEFVKDLFLIIKGWPVKLQVLTVFTMLGLLAGGTLLYWNHTEKLAVIQHRTFGQRIWHNYQAIIDSARKIIEANK